MSRFDLLTAAALCAVVIIVPSVAHAEIAVFQNASDNGWFVPFTSTTPDGVLFGDSGWLSDSQPETFTLTRMELGLAVQDGTAPGTTDIVFTLNDGDPSGLVFGSGAELWSTVISDVALPAGTGPTFFTLSIDLPNIETLGGFNNVGWSVGVQNYEFDGDFGFQVGTAGGQQIGFYTNNASEFDGDDWSLFSFGPDPNTGVANFVATIYIPEPGSLALLGIGAVTVLRRRRV